MARSRSLAIMAIALAALLMVAAVRAGDDNDEYDYKLKGKGKGKVAYKPPKYTYEYKDIYIDGYYCPNTVVYKLKELLEYASYKYPVKLTLYSYGGASYSGQTTTVYTYPKTPEVYEEAKNYYSYSYPMTAKVDMDDYMYVADEGIYMKSLPCAYYKLSVYFIYGYSIKVYNVYFRVYDEVKEWYLKDCKYPTYSTYCYANQPTEFVKNEYPYNDYNTFCSLDRTIQTKYPICGYLVKKTLHYDLDLDEKYKYP